jgi:hypothetical protein
LRLLPSFCGLCLQPHILPCQSSCSCADILLQYPVYCPCSRSLPTVLIVSCAPRSWFLLCLKNKMAPFNVTANSPFSWFLLVYSGLLPNPISIPLGPFLTYFSSTLKMKPILSSEVCVNTSLATQHRIPEDNSFQ